ncbi:hypothetical protein ACFFMP_10135 [Pseudoroseomonas cervicalis]|uniref:hypothetical protein n=1 Tax=Teichococcus cervicalis TaxID=204525 RepID=UPI0035ECB60A
MTGTALLVIDAQDSFRHRPYFREDDLPAYLERQQALIDGAAARGLPVLQVFHVERSRGPSPRPRAMSAPWPRCAWRPTRCSASAGTARWSTAAWMSG